jgi:hypothetical protein
MLTHPVAQTIEHWPLARFIHYARNPRKNDHAVDRMAASISEFGFKVPVLARSSGDVIDGHLRLKAAQKLGIAEIPVIVCDGTFSDAWKRSKSGWFPPKNHQLWTWCLSTPQPNSQPEESI